MCDYSLNTFPNRLVRDGEELRAHRFPSGCTGFISAANGVENRVERRGMWSALKTWFFPRRHDGPTAVCIPPGAVLVLESVANQLRRGLRLDETEQAVFIQLTNEEFSYRDGLRFRNGTIILLQQLPEGQRAFVSLLPGAKIGSVDDPVLEEVYA